MSWSVRVHTHVWKQSDFRRTFSSTDVAFIFSSRWGTCFPSLSPLLGSCHTLLFKSAHPFITQCSPQGAVRRRRLPCWWINSAVQQVCHQTVLVTFERTAPGAFTTCQLSIEHSFWQSVIRHATKMPCPAKLGAKKNSLNSRDLATIEHLSIWDFVLPPDSSNAP